jgi:hypothetical protein
MSPDEVINNPFGVVLSDHHQHCGTQSWRGSKAKRAMSLVGTLDTRKQEE